jgi:hypothetical protein
MAVPSTDVVAICYQWGFFGWLLVSAALGWGRGLWLGATWYACRAGQLYWIALAATGAASWALQYTVATLLLRGEPPYPACNNNIRAAPDLAVWLLYHYWTLAIVHDAYHGRLLASWLRTVRRIAEAVCVPLILVYTGNTTWAYAAEGAGFGVAMGVLSALLLLALWMPRMSGVALHARWAGLGHVDDPRDTQFMFF